MPKRALLLGLNIVISAALLTWLWMHFDLSSAFNYMADMDWHLAAAAFAVLLMHGVLSAWRWRTIIVLLDGTLNWTKALQLFFISMFFNQTLSTTIVGDAARVWMLHREGTTIGAATSGIVLERVAAIMALLPLITLGIALLPGPLHLGLWFVAFLAMCCSIALPLAAPLAKSSTAWITALGCFAAAGRRVLFSRGGIWILAQSLLIHLGAGFATYLLAQSVGLAPDFGLLLALTPPVLLLTTLPISFGGWGPREAGLIWLFGLFGIAAAPALAVSVALGVLVMMAGLPGGALWLSRLARRSPTG